MKVTLGQCLFASSFCETALSFPAAVSYSVCLCLGTIDRIAKGMVSAEEPLSVISAYD